MHNLLFSTTKRTELSSLLHSSAFINILEGISLQSSKLEYYSFIPLHFKYPLKAPIFATVSSRLALHHPQFFSSYFVCMCRNL